MTTQELENDTCLFELLALFQSSGEVVTGYTLVQHSVGGLSVHIALAGIMPLYFPVDLLYKDKIADCLEMALDILQTHKGIGQFINYIQLLA